MFLMTCHSAKKLKPIATVAKDDLNLIVQAYLVDMYSVVGT